MGSGTYSAYWKAAGCQPTRLRHRAVSLRSAEAGRPGGRCLNCHGSSPGELEGLHQCRWVDMQAATQLPCRVPKPGMQGSITAASHLAGGGWPCCRTHRQSHRQGVTCGRSTEAPSPPVFGRKPSRRSRALTRNCQGTAPQQDRLNGWPRSQPMAVPAATHPNRATAMPCHAIPYHALPCHTMPCHSMPCPALPCHAPPCKIKAPAQPAQRSPCPQ